MDSIRVLLVDDSQEFLSSAADFLRRDPRITIAGMAGSGQEGVSLAVSLSPDLVLMDFLMPVMDGIKATELIKSARPASRVVIVTLHDVEPIRRRALEAGADGMISKNEFSQDVLAFVDTFFGTEATTGGSHS